MNDKPDIIFVVLDTQRADRFSCYNTQAPVTPHFDRLAKDATLFKHAVSPAQWTLPAHASMFTGLYPSQHTVQQLDSVLPKDIPTLAERLSEVGYSTHVYSNNPIIGLMDNGMTRGFEQVHNFIHIGFNLWSTASDSDPASGRPLIQLLRKIRAKLAMLLGVSEEPTVTWWINGLRFLLEMGINLIGGTKFRNTRRTLDAAARMLNRSPKDGKPVFTFINLMGTHIPYDPPRWAIKRVTKTASMPVLRPAIRWKMNYLQQNPINWHKIENLLPKVKQTLLTYYDAEVVAQDHLLGRFVRKLHKAGRFDETCIIIVSDHGDHLGEKGRVNHIFGAYESLMHVPLLIRDPSQMSLQRSLEITNFVSTRQLYHTILSFAGIETQKELCILPNMKTITDSKEPVGTVFAESLPPNAFVRRLHNRYPQFKEDLTHRNTVYALYHKYFKLINQRDKPPEMYAVITDPNEEINLVDIEQNRYVQLQAILDSYVDNLLPLAPAILRDNTENQIIDRLRDLGYVD